MVPLGYALGGSLLLLTVLIPRRYFASYLLWWVMAIWPLWLALDLLAWMHGLQGVLADVILMFLLLAVVQMPALLVRSVWLLIFPSATEHAWWSNQARQMRGTPFMVTCLQAIVLGVVAGAYYYDKVGTFVQALPSPLSSHLMAAMLPLIAALAWLRKPKAIVDPWRLLRRCFYAAFAVTSAVFILGDVAYMALVMARAEAAAGEAPYCLQTNSNRPVVSLLQLSALLLRSDNASQYHSLMAVDRAGDLQVLNWSYRKRDYDPWRKPAGYVAKWQPIYCEPRQHFVKDLGLLTAAPTPDISVRFLDRLFVIPRAYDPSFYEGEQPGLSFLGYPPDFLPAQDIVSARRDAMVDVNLTGNSWWPMIASDVQTDQLNQPDTIETMAGLHKCRSESMKLSKDSDQYCSFAPSGTLQTFVNCFQTKTGGECQHYFTEAGRRYMFRHRESDLAQWQIMQRKLVALVESWSQSDHSSFP